MRLTIRWRIIKHQFGIPLIGKRYFTPFVLINISLVFLKWMIRRYVKWVELDRKVPVKSWTLPELEKQTHGECSTRGKVWEKTALYFNYWLSCTYIFRLRIDSAENTSFSINNWRQTISDFYLFIELTIFTFGELCCKNILKLYLDSR